ncbi:MAG TPA: PEP-CTERM sorting domain-containing protein [Phycisphaeraceae bacterium]
MAYAAPDAEAGTVTASPQTGFTTLDNSKDHVLTSASPTFTADLSTFATFTSEAYSLLGSSTADGIADFEHQAADGPDGVHGDIFLPYAMVGRNANGETGTIIYKFVVQSGYETDTGGTVAMNVYFRHDPDTFHGDNAWVGIHTSVSIPGGLYWLLNDGDFDRVTMRERFGGGGGFNTYTGLVTLDIPVGATTFYVAISDVFQGGYSSARLAIGSLEVNANLRAVPEPASMALMGGALALFVMRRR